MSCAPLCSLEVYKNDDSEQREESHCGWLSKWYICCTAGVKRYDSHTSSMASHSFISVADFKRVLKTSNITSLHAIQDFNKVLVHSDEGLDAYSLDIMARVVLGLSRPQDLDASRERISGQDVAVLFARVEKVERRTIGSHPFLLPT